jgi:hypothetical protein
LSINVACRAVAGEPLSSDVDDDIMSYYVSIDDLPVILTSLLSSEDIPASKNSTGDGILALRVFLPGASSGHFNIQVSSNHIESASSNICVV